MTTSPLFTEPVPTPLAIVRAIEEAGIEYVFGMSGGNLGRIVRALMQEKTSIKYMTLKQESVAAAMAEVYGRLRAVPACFSGRLRGRSDSVSSASSRPRRPARP